MAETEPLSRQSRVGMQTRRAGYAGSCFGRMPQIYLRSPSPKVMPDEQENEMIQVKMLHFSRQCVERGQCVEFHQARLRRIAARIIAGNYM